MRADRRRQARKLRVLPAIIASVIILWLIGASACNRAPHIEQPVIRRYELKGRVESLDFDRKRVTIAHEEIKDYMEAMTMSFAVKDENILRQLKSGDRLQAILVYDTSTNLSWLEDIKVISTN
jgi:Cu/Ag efflux protein CusF